MSTQLEEKLNRILSEKKEKIIPENIRAGISIFDVEGSFETLDTSDATATPSDVLDGKIAYSANDTRIEGTYIPLDTSDATATETDILLGKTAYVNGEKLTGTYEVKGEEITITPSNVEQTEEGLFSKVTVTGDENLISENIKKGVSIFNVEGQFEGQSESEYNVMIKANSSSFGLFPSMIKVKSIDFEGVIDAQSTFSSATALTEILELKNTGKIKNWSSFFANCAVLKEIPKIDTSSATNMYNMFYNCKIIKTIPDLKTENVTNMNSMFYGCSSLKNIIGISDTSKVNNTGAMFSKCSNLEEIPEIDTSNVTNMSNMFYGCTNLNRIPEIDTSNVTNMSYMFQSCKNIIEIPEINTSKVTDMYSMCHSCLLLTTVPELNCQSINKFNTAFAACSELINLNGFLEIGKAYTSKSKNYNNYKVYLAGSPNLTHKSLLNVINNLYDLNLTYDVAGGGTLYTQSLVLGETNLAKLTAEEIAIATAKRMDR